MSYSRNLILLFLSLILVACGENQVTGVNLPENYRSQFAPYLRVDRKDGTIRELYISPETIQTVRNGRPLPDHTVIVIEAFNAEIDDNGDLVLDAAGWYIKAEPLEMIHVIEKRSNWSEADFSSEARTGNWNFQSYDYTTGQHFDEDLNACFNCHNGTAETDFIYTYPQILAYERTGEQQYFFCELEGRVAC